MATTEQLTIWLSEAEVALHKLQTGRSVRVVVDGNNSERVEYTTASISKLQAYIADLKRQLGMTTPGPLRFWF